MKKEFSYGELFSVLKADDDDSFFIYMIKYKPEETLLKTIESNDWTTIPPNPRYEYLRIDKVHVLSWL